MITSKFDAVIIRDLTTRRMEYVYGKSRKLAKVEYEGDIDEAQVYYYHYDLMGSPILMTDTDGEEVWKGDYMPFGEDIAEQVNWGNAYTYLGNEDDGGLMFFNARYYQKGVGRFISCDAIKSVSSNLVINPYVYCGNNPVSYKDPTGLSREPRSYPDVGDGGGGQRQSRNTMDIMTAISTGKVSVNAGLSLLTSTKKSYLIGGNYPKKTQNESKKIMVESQFGDARNTLESSDESVHLMIAEDIYADEDGSLGTQEGVAELEKIYGDRISYELVSNWDVIANGVTEQANSDMSYIVLIAHGSEGYLEANGNPTSSSEIAKGLKDHYFKSSGERGLLVWACLQSSNDWNIVAKTGISVIVPSRSTGFSGDGIWGASPVFIIDGNVPRYDHESFSGDLEPSEEFGYSSGGYGIGSTITKWLGLP